MLTNKSTNEISWCLERGHPRLTFQTFSRRGRLSGHGAVIAGSKRQTRIERTES